MNTQGTATMAHERHLEAIKRISTTEGRRDYIDGVKRAEGAFASKWLSDDFAAWWAKQHPKRGRA